MPWRWERARARGLTGPGRREDAPASEGYLLAVAGSTSARISAEWPTGVTFGQTCLILPSLPMRYVIRRALPLTTGTLYFAASSPFSSGMSENGSLYFSANALWLVLSCVETPNTCTPAFCSLAQLSRMSQASLVQPGVSSFG